MTSSLDLIRGRQVVQTLTNQSGGSVIAGDVVVVDTGHDESFVTTTTAAYNASQVGIALDSIAAAASGRVLLQGYAPLVNVSASATRAYYLFTHTVAKQATSGASFVAGAFGQVLKAGTTPSAYIFPPAIGSTAGITRSGSTTGDHLAVWNGSNADSLKDGGAAGVAPGFVKLSETVLVAPAANFDFNTISGSYSHLKLLVQARSDVVAAQMDVHLTFNADGGSNYDNELLQGINATASASNIVAGAQNYIGIIPAASGTANFAGGLEITVFNYSRTTFYKNYNGAGGSIGTAASNFSNRVTTGQWRNTAAVTRVTLTPTSGNFIAGSVATLYGLT